MSRPNDQLQAQFQSTFAVIITDHQLFKLYGTFWNVKIPVHVWWSFLSGTHQDHNQTLKLSDRTF